MSIDSNAAFTNTDAIAFPDNAAVNSTGPSTDDGTEFVKIMIDNYMFGPMQAILDRTGQTPNGITEAAGASQFLDGLDLMCNAPGIVTEWNLAADPATTGHRALLLQGQGLLRASYADLDSAVYVGDGNNAAVAAAGGGWYRADDAGGVTPNIAGLYLILPESRGVVPRGLDTAASIDPDGASRYVGDPQIDAGQGHWHEGFGRNDNAALISNGAGTQYLQGVESGGTAASIIISPARAIITDGVNGTPRVSTETRMYNRSTRFVVWY